MKGIEMGVCRVNRNKFAHSKRKPRKPISGQAPFALISIENVIEIESIELIIPKRVKGRLTQVSSCCFMCV